ncbi:unnamed protein product [Caenorhabditis angaria]|uniref:Uncharacterized protein n=1 Tax=Caenorhabditis angaria TaxID=860376 RepID=A0A9P1J0P6_9PELO|nr:unnamed protein product [Caenorhabditis angaria]
MKQVKEEVIDLEYEEQEEWRKQQEEDEDALMVARRIKQEFREESTSPPVQHRTNVQIIQENIRAEIERPAPLVFDHFICMRIGLNSRNNVQRLMALLAAHEFVDLTVLPSPSIVQAPIPQMIPMGLPPRIIAQCPQEATTSNMSNTIEEENRVKHLQQQNISRNSVKKSFVKKITSRPVIRPSPSADCGIIPITMHCKKCDEVIPKGSHGSLALNHVQKTHLKMAAFQCRICKHYRTTQERIQSHVTTVHKAKSTKFDSSLAGPLSSEDMKKMEEMITHCFPPLKMQLQVTDRLIARTMEVDLSGRK